MKGQLNMIIKQISVFLENKQGRLAFITEVLAKNNINIRALSLADSTDFGVLRLIVDDPLAAEQKLKGEGLTVSVTDVVSVAIDDRPGGLAKVLKTLDETNIGAEYVYAFVGSNENKAYVVLKVRDTALAVKVLKENGYNQQEKDEVYKI